MRSKDSLKKSSQRARRKLIESSDEVNIRKRLDAQRMANKRNIETPVQAECRRIKMAHYMRERQKMETPEQTEGRKIKKAHDMRERRNMETPEQTESRIIKMAHDMRERRNMETPEQTEGRKIKMALDMRERRNMETSEQTESRRIKMAHEMRERRNMETPEQTEGRKMKKRQNMDTPEQVEFRRRRGQFGGINLENRAGDEDYEDENVPLISQSIEVELSVKKAFEHLMKTKVGPDEKIPDELLEKINTSLSSYKTENTVHIPIYDQLHQANVCVICDRFITGTAELFWIHKNTLLQHKSRLQIQDLNPNLQQCYKVDDHELDGLLLSPRARVKITGEYLCCSQCNKALKIDKMDKNPPKFAIANNFAIGSLPQYLSNLLTDVTSPLLSPIRPFVYVMSYYGGAHKSITGSYSFFNQDVEKNIGTLNYHANTTSSMNVYVVMSGNFTPNQRQIIKSRCQVDIGHFQRIYTWLRENNPIYSKMADIPNCPMPIIIEDENGIDEESENGNLENQIEIQYWFPNNGNPNNSTSTFTSESHLVDALLKSQEPTLIFTSKNYQPDYKIFLPQVFPLTFPFGVGGLEENRRTHVSVEECLKHYLNISLPMFQHSDIILLISHMYFRKKSFQSAYLKCKSRSSLNGCTTGEHLSKISESEILELSKKTKKDVNNQIGRPPNQLIHTVSAACKSIPYSDEAAKEARAKLFSMWYTFGPPAVFFTISPGDECSFRIKLYLNLKMDMLPQPTSDESDLIADFHFRSKLRIDNPGACAREYNSIMQIIMEALIGWDFKEKKQTSLGIFGKILGFSDTSEEQGRKTLHSHVLLFIALFDRLISLLWSDSENVRKLAKEELIRYMSKAMSSSYELVEEDFLHEKKGEKLDCSISTCQIVPSVVHNQVLRNMRHQRYCHILKGFVGKCDGCGQNFTSSNLIWNAVKNWKAKLDNNDISNYFILDQILPLS